MEAQTIIIDNLNLNKIIKLNMEMFRQISNDTLRAR